MLVCSLGCGVAFSEPVELAGQLVDLLVAHNFAGVTSHFDAQMAEFLPVDGLTALWIGLETDFGPLQEKGEVTTAQQDGITGVRFESLFERSMVRISFFFTSDEKVAGFMLQPGEEPLPWERPAYVDEGKFREEEVIVGSGKWQLPGTLSLPMGEGPFPAVVLVHGSGAHDRDETIGPSKPFKDLAWGLACRGIAVLRYDKRTYCCAGRIIGDVERALTVKEETVDDALLAVTLLRTRLELDPKRLFVLGHSLGGMLIPRLGARDEDIGGFIVMAGVDRPLEDAITAQNKYLTELDGTVDEAETYALTEIAKLVALIKSPDLKPDEKQPLFSSYAPYWLDLRGYQPAEEAKALKRPVLVLQGERDWQVSQEEFNRWKAALEGSKGFAAHLYPSLNHLFLPGEGPSSLEEYDIPGNIPEEVISDIASWIGQLPGPEE
jgi:dienelactone hydrolase